MALPCILCGCEASGLLCHSCKEDHSFEGNGNAKPCEKHQLLHFYGEECPACKLEEELKITNRGAAISSLGQMAANRVAARRSSKC